ncbi:tRNA(Met) cytidine acetyltransferase TmcA [Marinobacter sp. F4216]|uniref:tRNA(Met) cytidine acetyltransferase TmcA n=1 Tax=Marinobacter sp. F4216 TaxID=2874281 RepID=UPI001CBB8D0C|nr:GNAT family N-acetyltransferase [Marinobacter sp. F4216]MBZ2169305.1 GNAT family N-acetyltransferase [Marinobacter sp. F4216]
MPAEPAATPVTARWRLLQERLQQRGERRLVLVEGERSQAVAWVRQVLAALPEPAGLWTGPSGECPAAHLVTVPPRRADQWLGQELSVVVWDGWQGNPPDGIAALSGTLRTGGLFFWLMPPLEHWPHFDDPGYARTGLDGRQAHPFAARLARILAADASVLRINPEHGDQVPFQDLPEPESPFTVQTTREQQVLVDRLVQCGLGRRRRPLVLTADRGRGKSAALGMAAAELLRQGRTRIVISAPLVDNVSTLFRHAREALGSELLHESDHELTTRSGGRICFLPVRELLAQQPEAGVVMVDEAAAIAAPLLRQVLLGWPRVIFASTVHGYEGSGRGFAIRFRQVLDRETPHWQPVSLTAPVRWSDQDPLEPLISDLFLLAADSEPADVQASGESSISVESWSPGTADESELAEAFGLLVNAHYRTTPSDLRQWMDAPDVVCWRARRGGHTVGVLWAAVEGGLDAGLAEQVTLGTRRPRGHMLPQSLASHSGFPEAASQRCLRVVRVAVSEGVRRLGVGQRLVEAAAEYAGNAQLDSLGTSFGGSPDLLAFWQSCGLDVVRVGLGREATSGEYPLQMLRGVSPAGQALQQRLKQRLTEHWQILVPLAWVDMDARLLAALTCSLPAEVRLSGDDRRDLVSFAHGHRGFLLTLPVLGKLNQVPGVMDWLREQPDLPLWVAAVLRQQPWAHMQADRLCTGQRDGEDRLRALVRCLLEHPPEM